MTWILVGAEATKWLVTNYMIVIIMLVGAFLGTMTYFTFYNDTRKANIVFVITVTLLCALVTGVIWYIKP